MNNIDKEKINNNINEAYNNQTDKVKELLDSAKKSLDTTRNTKGFVVKKEKAKQAYETSRVISRNRNKRKSLENVIDNKFSEMQEKLDISSKNLDFIFDSVSKNNNDQMELINSLNKTHEENLQKNISKSYEEFADKLIKRQLDAENKMVESQVEASNKMIESHGEVINKIYKANKEMAENINQKQFEIKDELLNLQKNMANNILVKQDDMQKQILGQQEKLREDIVSVNNNITKNIVSKQVQLRDNIISDQKINQEEFKRIIAEEFKKQQENSKQEFYDLKNEMINMYKNENKHSINVLLQERQGYLKELEQKDRQIRELNYRIYEMEEKLEEEKAKRYKPSLWNLLFRKESYEEEQPVYTSQILSYVYQYNQ